MTDGAPSYRELPISASTISRLCWRRSREGGSAFAMIHLVFSNLKTWLLGTHHGRIEPSTCKPISTNMFSASMPFYPMTAFNSALGLAARSVSPTYASFIRASGSIRDRAADRAA